MIAFNELMNNLEQFTTIYNVMGVKFNHKVFIALEKKLKRIQNQAESMRANCNKICGEIISIKSSNKNANTTYKLKQATSLNKNAHQTQLKVEQLLKKINKKLKKLPNIPDHTNTTNIQIDTMKNKFNLSDFKEAVLKTYSITNVNQNINSFLKNKKNVIFKSNELPKCVSCKNKNFLILCHHNDYDLISNDLLNYFQNHSQSIIEQSIINLNKSSCKEYFIHLSSNEYLHIQFKREYCSRDFKIKYHDLNTDSTKFVNQINLIFK